MITRRFGSIAAIAALGESNPSPAKEERLIPYSPGDTVYVFDRGNRIIRKVNKEKGKVKVHFPLTKTQEWFPIQDIIQYDATR